MVYEQLQRGGADFKDDVYVLYKDFCVCQINLCKSFIVDSTIKPLLEMTLYQRMFFYSSGSIDIIMGNEVEILARNSGGIHISY